MALFVLPGFVARGGVTLHSYPLEDFSSDTAYLVLEIIGENTVKIQYEGRLTIVKLLGIGTPITTYPNLPANLLKKTIAPLMRDLLLGEFVYLRFDTTNRIDTDGQLLAYLYRAQMVFIHKSGTDQAKDTIGPIPNFYFNIESCSSITKNVHK